MNFDSYLWVPSKAGYVKGGERPKVDCILCSIADEDPEVRKLEVWRGDSCMAVLNLYPYNPGHLMVFPFRHLTELSDLQEKEQKDLLSAINLATEALKRAYSPGGFNIGFNIGQVSGASIKHLHAHIVPRFESELGFIDIIGNGRIMIEDPEKYLGKIRSAFSEVSK